MAYQKSFDSLDDAKADVLERSEKTPDIYWVIQSRDKFYVEFPVNMIRNWEREIGEARSGKWIPL